MRAAPERFARTGGYSRVRLTAGGADPQLHLMAMASGDSLLLAMLTLFNESADMDDAIQQSLDMVTTALGGRVGEIWLVMGEARDVELRYSSSDGSHQSRTFHAAGRPLSGDAAPAFVGRVVRTGRGSSTALSDPNTGGERGAEADALGLRTSLAFPIRTSIGVVGALVVFSESLDRAARDVLDAIPIACHHIGRFFERVRAEGAIHEAARELSALASTDSLTGLKNRREFDRALRTIPREPFAVLSIDVDRLKETNDTYGHPAGDALLRTVGNTLGLVVRGWDVLARVGGDEFAALLPGVGVFGAALVAERMRLAVHALVLPSGPVRIAAGWSAAPTGADPVSVWQRADESLYKAKHGGGDRVEGCSYERGEAGDIADRSYSDVVMRILDGGPLITMFQPIVNLVDGTVMGYEALARPEGFAAMDSVEDVFEAARVGGQIRDLDWVCRRRAVEDARTLPMGTALFLNMSAAALLDPIHGVDQLLLLLRSVDRTPRSVVIEITEHERIRDYAALRRVLASYRAERVRFALDDVGEGHSTLELLASSGSEYLKLGRSLTMTSSRMGSHAAMEATMAFARTSGAVVIAEGVENEFVADLMKEAGIQFGQGFGLGKPTVAAGLEDVGAALAGRAALSGLRPRRASLRARSTHR
ncbi:MAG TPA: bifunctional diguanylate cyclase/phosphodiesterase [Candidatus Dormibacteraeota bacterium]|nr:bifunctional diguanylate cyclase/phosphodiesterase [Candidatus Dormibacteraeota bacterium]